VSLGVAKVLPSRRELETPPTPCVCLSAVAVMVPFPKTVPVRGRSPKYRGCPVVSTLLTVMVTREVGGVGR